MTIGLSGNMAGHEFTAGAKICRGDGIAVIDDLHKLVGPVKANADQILGVALQDAKPGRIVKVLVGVDPNFNAISNSRLQTPPYNPAGQVGVTFASPSSIPNDSSDSSAMSSVDVHNDEEILSLQPEDMVVEVEPVKVIKVKPTAKQTRKAIRMRKSGN